MALALQVVLVVLLICCSTAHASAQVDIQGPGLVRDRPLSLEVSPPGGVTAAVFVFYNRGAAEVSLFPSIQCPIEKILVSVLSFPLRIPAGQARQVQAHFTALANAHAAHEEVPCLISSGATQASLYVRMVNPRRPSPNRLALDLHLAPQSVQSESVEYLIDFESNLQLSLTFSGLSASSDVGWGVTGLEFAILRLQGVLGVFDLHDEFVFAAPFGLHNQSLAEGRVSFVKKRVSMRFNLYGLEVENLVLFENVKFTHPFFDNVEALDALQTPSFRFGDLLRLRGQTDAGVPFGAAFGLCADPAAANLIKKRSFPASACDADLLAFALVQLQLGPLELAGLKANAGFELRPPEGAHGSLSISTRLLELVNVNADLSLSGLEIGSLSLSLSGARGSLTLAFDEGLALANAFTVVRIALGPARLSLSLHAASDGLSSLSVAMDLALGSSRLGMSVQFSRPAAGKTVALSHAQVSWRGQVAFVQVDADVRWSDGGLRAANLAVALDF